MPNTESFSGRYTFPGVFAFFDTPASAQPVLLQFDDPFTGNFDRGVATQTSRDLQDQFQDGDPGEVTGVLQDTDVNGIVRPVLFFSSATGAPAETHAAVSSAAASSSKELLQ